MSTSSCQFDVTVFPKGCWINRRYQPDWKVLSSPLFTSSITASQTFMYVQTTRAVCGLRICISNKLPGDIDAKPRLRWLVLNFMVLEELCGLPVNAQTRPPQPRPCKSELRKWDPSSGSAQAENQGSKDSPRVLTHREAEPLLSPSRSASLDCLWATETSLLLPRVCWEPRVDTDPPFSGMCESVNAPRQLEGTFLFFPTSWFPFSLLFATGRELSSSSGLVEQWFSAVGGFASQETLTKSGYVYDSPWFKTPAFSWLSSYGALSGPLLIQGKFSLWCHFISPSTLILMKVPPPTGLGSTYI